MKDAPMPDLFSPIPEVFEFANFVPKFESLIRSEVNFVPGSLVVSLNAPFGGGKSTFLELWSNRLKKNSGSEFQPNLIQVNAWEDDYVNDPLASLVVSIAVALSGDRNEKESSGSRTRSRSSKRKGTLRTFESLRRSVLRSGVANHEEA